jgi:hypothetical protein
MSATHWARSTLRATAAAVALLLAIGGAAARAAGPPGHIVVPPSTLVKADDIGRRVRTNILLMVPAGGFPASAGTANPVTVSGDLVETPASLACA